ncbi:polysaccharide biosynthesis/export family protein [Methylobacterium planeticum]|uniref:Sugar ABC transporter substrate-binding protein n=1 Tax=Methylobacterium planeticum TaxID=2615211 RepID=A0A6N6MKE1_9HYPH|nr:polysaccharide biosynthesis/export family protein [Methylobacterium planeticum]KAB1069571.1 sugar ABC transporter substrate-binding protein [Methylobacterium planeticum]
MPSRPRHRIARLVVAAGLAVLPSVGFAAGYTLGPQDKIRIKVVEWRSSIGQFFEWTPLVGEFAISSAGDLSLPLVGEIRAVGLRTDELSAEIARRLRDRVGLVDLPAASVEVSQFRPFYILGLVDKPGEYQFRPGMSVIQAVGVAGGLYRPTEAGLVRMQRDAIAATGDYRLREVEIRTNQAKETRLLAELEGRDTIVFPPELSASEASRDLIRGEELTFRTRRDTLNAQIEGAERLIDLFRNEIVALTGKVKSQDRQLDLINKEKDGVANLVSKGLAIVPRQYVLERTAAEIESKRLDLDTAILRAKQEMTKAERSIIDFRNDRRRDILTELQEVRARRAEAEQRAETARTLVHEAEVIAPRLLADRIRSQRLVPLYTLLRQTREGPREMSVSEHALLEPGDVLKVDSEDADQRVAVALPDPRRPDNGRSPLPR